MSRRTNRPNAARPGSVDKSSVVIRRAFVMDDSVPIVPPLMKRSIGRIGRLKPPKVKGCSFAPESSPTMSEQSRREGDNVPLKSQR
jgi:hypothetical protein